MKVAVIGAGAIGCVFATRLAKAGAEVELYDVNAAHVEAINQRGLKMDSVLGNETFHLPAFTAPELKRVADLVIVLTVTSATEDAARAAAELVKRGGMVLTLQNGIGNVEKLAAHCGANDVLAGSTFNSAAYLGPGHIHHTNLGHTTLGETAGPVSERVRDLVAMLQRGGLPTDATDNAIGHVWSKFALNCAINPIAAVTGMRSGQIARDVAAFALLERNLEEILQVVARKGIQLPDKDIRATVFDHCWERFNKPSMLQHVERGRKTEIDALNGALVREAHQLGVAVPVNETLVLAITALQEQRRYAVEDKPLDEAALEAEAARTPRVRPRPV